MGINLLNKVLHNLVVVAVIIVVVAIIVVDCNPV
jgi:hypothetical protein